MSQTQTKWFVKTIDAVTYDTCDSRLTELLTKKVAEGWEPAFVNHTVITAQGAPNIFIAHVVMVREEEI